MTKKFHDYRKPATCPKHKLGQRKSFMEDKNGRLWTREEIAEKVGKSLAYVSTRLRSEMSVDRFFELEQLKKT